MRRFSMKFNNPPKNSIEKEKKAEAFINFMDANTPQVQGRQRVKEKEQTHALSMRLPVSLVEDLKEISYMTGLSINAFCIDTLRPAVRKKLKELIEYGA